MTLVPDLEIGLWNAWIMVVTFYVASLLPLFIRSARAEARMQGEPPFRRAGTGYRVGAIVTHAVLMPVTLIYSFFVPLEAAGWWLVSGLIVSVLGIALALAASVSFAGAPLGMPLTGGIYAVSRHPMYVGTCLAYAGAGLAGTSWVLLACAVVAITAWRFAVPEEERNMVAKYGPAYEEYLERTPRWMGLAKARPQAGPR